MGDVYLGERVQRAREEIGHRISRELPVESKQSVAIDAKRGRLHGADVVRSKLHLVRPSNKTEIVVELVRGCVHQTRRRESAGALKITSDIDIGIGRQRLI